MNEMKSSHLEIYPCENGWTVTGYDPSRMWAFEDAARLAEFVRLFLEQQKESSNES